jgi:ethanolamine utilization protein EutQ (cupin superfamily)
MGDRANLLSKIVLESQEWVSFSDTDIWHKLRQRIEREIIDQAKEAFHTTSIDGKSNDELVRNMMSQRSAVKVANQIIMMVEAERQRLKNAQDEITKIETKKQGGKK